MTHRELITYCQTNGINHVMIPLRDFEVLRVLDLSQLPGSMRGYFDVETGVYNQPLSAEPEKSPDVILLKNDLPGSVLDDSVAQESVAEHAEIVAVAEESTAEVITLPEVAEPEKKKKGAK